MPLPAAAPAIISGAFGLFGGERRNRVDQREALKSRQFQSAEADKNRNFQERMRNSQWQAGVADMEAAGLNPALAYSQGGASSPSGSMAGGAQASGAENTASSAMDLAQQKKALSLLTAQTDKAKSEAEIANQQARETSARTSWWLDYSPKGRDRAPLFDLLESELGTARAGAANTRAMADRNRSLSNLSGLAGIPAGILNRAQSWLYNQAGQASSRWFQSQRYQANPLYRRPRR